MLEIKITGNVASTKLVTTAGKSSVLNVNMATNRKVGEKEFTDWTSVKIWGERAEKLAAHIAKGSKLLVTGRPEARGYVAADGTAKAELVVHAADIEFLSAKPKDGGETHEPPAHAEEAAELALDTVAA